MKKETKPSIFSNLFTKHDDEEQDINASIENEDTYDPLWQDKDERYYTEQGGARRGNMESRKTIIAEGVEIVGDVVVDGDLELYGSVKGNVSTNGHVRMMDSAKVEGNVESENLEIGDSEIIGDIKVEESAILEIGTQISGNVEAGTVVSSGNVMGNIISYQDVLLKEDSVVEGDLSVGGLEVNSGAIIRGRVDINQLETERETDTDNYEIPSNNDLLFEADGDGYGSNDY